MRPLKKQLYISHHLSSHIYITYQHFWQNNFPCPAGEDIQRQRDNTFIIYYNREICAIAALQIHILRVSDLKHVKDKRNLEDKRS